VPLGDSLIAFKLGAVQVPQQPTPKPPALRRPISGNPVSGVNVTFTAPASGASGRIANNTTTTTAVPDAHAGPGRHHGDVHESGSNANTTAQTQFFEGLFNFSLAPGQSATYTFTKAGEYFFNDCQNPRSTERSRFVGAGAQP
jgi:hypothetical protein